MGLGDLLFGKKPKKNKINSKHSFKKNNIDDVVVFGRGKYAPIRELRGQDLRSVSNIRVNGEKLNKQSLAELITSISKKTGRDVNLKDFRNYLSNSYRNNIRISYQDKIKLHKLVKNLAVKKMAKQKRGRQAKFSESNRASRRYTPQLDTEQILGNQSFVDRKQANTSSLRSRFSTGSSFQRLGITKVKEGFQRGHAVNVRNMMGNNPSEIKKSQAAGLTQSSSSKVALASKNLSSISSKPKGKGL